MTKLLQNCLLLGAGFALVKIISPVFKAVPIEQACIEVQAKIDQGTRIELFINRVWTATWGQPIETKIMKNYVFSKVPDKISSIRLDVTDASSAKIHLQSIQAHCPGRKKFYLALNLAELTFNDLKVISGPGQGLYLEAAGPDPWITIPVDLNLSTDPLARLAGHLLNSPMIAYFSIWLLVLIVVPPFSGFYSCVKIAGGSVLIYLVIFITLPLVLSTTHQLPSTVDSVGMAAYTGYSFESQKRGLFWMVFCALMLAPAMLVAKRRLRDK